MLCGNTGPIMFQGFRNALNLSAHVAKISVSGLNNGLGVFRFSACMLRGSLTSSIQRGPIPHIQRPDPSLSFQDAEPGPKAESRHGQDREESGPRAHLEMRVVQYQHWLQLCQDSDRYKHLHVHKQQLVSLMYQLIDVKAFQMNRASCLHVNALL